MSPPAKRGAKAARKTAPVEKARKKRAAARKPKTERRAERFVAEYLVDLNGRQAAIRAGYSPDTARQIASELLAKPEIQAAVEVRQKAMIDSLGVTSELVLSRLHAIATADPRELSELHRGCCRYCWGKDHKYQRTPQEMREARSAWEEEQKASQDKGAEVVKPFVEGGGVGYNPKRDPNPDCPECWGDGEERVVFKDTRDLSPAARLLFAGVEQTQNGLKLRTNSQPDALLNIGKHLGMFKSKVEHSGPGGGPIQQQHAVGELLDLVEGADTGPGPAASRRAASS